MLISRQKGIGFLSSEIFPPWNILTTVLVTSLLYNYTSSIYLSSLSPKVSTVEISHVDSM